MGISFSSRIGLGAGVDKNGLHLDKWAKCCGFIELGSVTMNQHSGHSDKLLLKDKIRDTIVNRLGCPNLGIDALIIKIREFKQTHPTFPVGVSIAITEHANPAAQFRECYTKLAPHVSWITLNLSSPNVPGLRDLQQAKHLETIFNSLVPRLVPICVKISPS